MTSEVSELPLLAKARRQVVLVDAERQLENFVGHLSVDTGWLAVDAERASGFKFSQRAYLVQFCTEDGPIYLLDPIAFSAAQLAPLVTEVNRRPWILHAATQDLSCLAELGFKPLQLFDTELIARLCGLERVGLGAVCELALKVRLAKEHSAADWSTRPLPENWLDYAALDVDVLHEIRSYLSGTVEATGKGQFVSEEMQHLLSFRPKPPKEDPWRSLSNFHDLKEPRQLSVAKELWEARDALARKLDVSPGRLVPDRSLVAAALAMPRSKSELAGNKEFNGRASRSYLDTWWQAVNAGLNATKHPPLRVSGHGIPNHRSWPQKFPEANTRLAKAKAVIAQVSEELAIPQENLLTPDYLRQVCWEPQDDIAQQLLRLGARNWQVALLAERISQAWEQESQDPTAAP